METKKLKILLIGNDKENLTAFTAAILKAIPETEVASESCGLNAVKLAKALDPDIIIIDISMAEDNALEISRTIKKEVELQMAPLLFVIDLETDPNVRIKAIEEGAEAFLIKPFDDSLLLTQLKVLAKIKEHNMLIKSQKKKLEDLVEIRTQKLKQEIVKYNKSENELQESNKKFKAYIEMSPMGVFIANRYGRYTEVNQKACQMTGYTREELLNLSTNDCLVPDELSKGVAGFSSVLEKGFAEEEYRIRKKDGQVKWVSFSGAKINDNCVIAFCQDISERKEREFRIEYLSFHDSLSNVYNRAFFEEESKRLNAEQHFPLSYIVSDINGLKLINDTFGHAVGDRFLIETAKILKTNTRKDAVVARVGGDEFALLLPLTSSSEAQIVVNRIRLACQETRIEINKERLTLSVALGYDTKTDSAENFEYISKSAEDSMYRQKLVERDSYHSSLLQSLRTSLFERSHETEEHASRLVSLTKSLGKAMGLNDLQLNDLELFSALHDIGKISIDNNILTKTSGLTENEWLEMKKHPGIGYRIAMASPDLKSIAEYILCHHERWDGKGYPQGLHGESTPLLSRILAIADAYDAMTSDRSYRKALAKDIAIAEISKNSGTQFDPGIVKLFLKIMPS